MLNSFTKQLLSKFEVVVVNEIVTIFESFLKIFFQIFSVFSDLISGLLDMI